MIKNVIRFPRDVYRVFRGIQRFRNKNFILNDEYQSMINLYCLSKGVSTDLISKFLTKDVGYKYNQESIFGDEILNTDRIVDEIRKNGFYIFKNKLSNELTDSLIKFSENKNHLLDGGGKTGEKGFYDRENPQAVRYIMAEEDLLNSQAVWDFMTDPLVVGISQKYLNCTPLIDLVTMWWSTCYDSKASEQAAQVYHFDMDRLKWLKFFVYLNDVTDKNGPHCFVRGSHLKKPYGLLKLGYNRIEDAKIKEFYSAESFLELIGKKGTVMVVDTSGYHKGKVLQEGHRGIFQVEFANCLFGTQYRISRVDKNILSEKVQKFISDYPYLFRKFKFE